MSEIKEQIEKVLPKKPRISWRSVWITSVIIFVIFGITTVGLISYANSYEGRVIPGVSLGEHPIGGMSREHLHTYLQDMHDKLLAEGVYIHIDTQEGPKSFTLIPVVVTETNSVDLVSIDLESEVNRFIDYGKEEDIFTRAFVIIRSRFFGSTVQLNSITLDRDRIFETIEGFLTPYQVDAKNASIDIKTLDPLEFSVVSSTRGVQYEYTGVLGNITAQWAVLQIPEIHLPSAEVEYPTIVEADIEPLLDDLSRVVDAGGVTLVYTNPQTSRKTEWKLTIEELLDWLVIEKNEEGKVAFSLNTSSTTEYIDSFVAPKVNQQARDAKFEMESGRVVQFQSSQPGIGVDVEETVEQMKKAFEARSLAEEGYAKTIQVVTKQVDPTVSVADANSLGITEILGTGISSYSGSPANRISNIRNAVRKLNGVLVPPGEEFSTIDHTKPYTIEGGYLPELVIKGDEIKPEIGGGLCQIGSTLFRMAMNSAMEITERRNHSLVVSYYNDLTNGLPGTDATIYDPAPDFRFRNDTNHHILIHTYMDEANQDLIFTIWGKNDGRNGSYTPPVVNRWIPHGETKFIETTKLAPGVKECQHAYTGADAAFTYTRTLPSGEVEETVFESHYRPLPQICLVGVEPNSEEGEDAEAQSDEDETKTEDIVPGSEDDLPLVDG